MVCSVDHLASGAGVAMLRSGGTAADAAVAASAVLAVTTQHMCGMGGDLFALVHHAPGDAPAALNASGRAGSGADADRLLAEGHRAVPFRGDIRAATVPGCVDGWVALHDRFGRLALAEVLAPAIAYAAGGFPASAGLALSHRAVADVAESQDYAPLRDGGVGTLIHRGGVAAALQAVAEGGRDAFYLGGFGQGLRELGGGLYSEGDLVTSQAEWVEPLGLQAWGHDLWTLPPNSQGYLSLAGAWLAERLPLPDDPDDQAWAHLLVEAAKQAGYDRLDTLHDRADGALLVAEDRLGPRLSAIGERAAPLPAPGRAGGTIYLCAVDADRMAVSLIQSNASGWGCHVVEPSTRIFLHNRAIGFTLEPGHPARLEAGRRPPHTLAPALVTSPDGGLRAVLGTMGGDAQPQVVLQLAARLLHCGQTPGTAVAAGRWRLSSDQPSGFDTWADPGDIVVEVEGHAAPWEAGLAERGHRVRRIEPHSGAFGHAHMIEVTPDDVLAGAADHRARNGGAVGW